MQKIGKNSTIGLLSAGELITFIFGAAEAHDAPSGAPRCLVPR